MKPFLRRNQPESYPTRSCPVSFGGRRGTYFCTVLGATAAVYTPERPQKNSDSGPIIGVDERCQVRSEREAKRQQYRQVEQKVME